MSTEQNRANSLRVAQQKPEQSAQQQSTDLEGYKI
jgi:hypothetical protein